MNNGKIQEYFENLKSFARPVVEANRSYFESLYHKYMDASEIDVVIHQPEEGIESNTIPLPILNPSDYPPIQKYEELSDGDSFKGVDLVMCKMHAGLGSSVKRETYLKEISGRDELGSKGTDLFWKVEGEHKSLAELQFIQARIIKKNTNFNRVLIQNLVNIETQAEVNRIKENYSEITRDDLLQLKVPTLQDNELTTKRLAPAGHAFVGFSLLSDIFLSESKSELMVIGNGEDLNSTPDTKILSWMLEKEIPICMMTTDKLEKDKKGGQISVVKTDEADYVTIIEKAQAEKANQLGYFEQLGLRAGDHKSLFNTNIAIINTRKVKELFEEHLTTSQAEFMQMIAPDLIKNIKVQDGVEFTQLEGALGSTLLNIDKYFRLNFNKTMVHFLNLNSKSREKFFIPIKKMEDFNELQERYEYNEETGRLDRKDRI